MTEFRLTLLTGFRLHSLGQELVHLDPVETGSLWKLKFSKGWGFIHIALVENPIWATNQLTSVATRDEESM